MDGSVRTGGVWEIKQNDRIANVGATRGAGDGVDTGNEGCESTAAMRRRRYPRGFQDRAAFIAMSLVSMIVIAMVFADDAGRWSKRVIPIASCLVALLSAALWGASAFLSGEKMRASRRHSRHIEGWANFTNFLAAMSTALALMLSAFGELHL